MVVSFWLFPFWFCHFGTRFGCIRFWLVPFLVAVLAVAVSVAIFGCRFGCCHFGCPTLFWLAVLYWQFLKFVDCYRCMLCYRIKVEDAVEKSEKRAAIAVQLKEGLLRLGPTFIKLGQLLSTRCVSCRRPVVVEYPYRAFKTRSKSDKSTKPLRFWW